MEKINSDEIKIRCDTFAVTAGKNGYVEQHISRSFHRSSIFRYGGALLSSVTYFSTKSGRFGKKKNNNNFGAKIFTWIVSVKLLYYLLL